MLAEYPERLRAANGDPAQLAAREGLVDEVLDRAQRRAYLGALVGARGDDGAYAAVDFDTYLDRARSRSLEPGTSTVAIVTAQGNMLPGTQELGAIGSDSLAALLHATAERDGVEAIVLRVTSGGGSVFASEIIREAMQEVRAEGTPIVVSMGSIAASGGYYIATAADRILATPTTLTGSIGVFGAFPTVDGLLARGGIFTDGVGTSPLAGGLRPDRPLAEPVADALQQGVDAIYERFLALVAESRDLDRAALEAVAEGRVLSAAQAREVGLIDGLGTLADATEVAAQIAGLEADAYEVISIEPAISPRQLLLQQLSETLGFVFAKPSSLSLQALLEHFDAALGPGAPRAEVFLLQRPDPRNLYMHCLPCAALM
jgi:protease-4